MILTQGKLTMKARLTLLTLILINVFIAINITGCSSLLSSKMPSGSVSMEQSYNDAINGTGGSEADGLNNGAISQASKLPLPIPGYNSYTRNQENEINSQFPQLPNPNIVMYVYPHQAGTGNTKSPVPGYSTVFPMYQHTHYAMPGEVRA